MAAAEPEAAKKLKTKSVSDPEATKKMSYLEMVTDAIATLKDRTGSSRQAITRHILVTHSLASPRLIHIKNAIKTGLEKGVIKPTRTTGKGAGCFKIVKEEKAKDGEKPKKKPMPKKIAAAGKTASISTPSKVIEKNLQKKTAKKTAVVPKAGAKKAAPKKVAKATPSKKATPKKAAVKPVKQPAAKKAAKKPAAAKEPKKATKKPAKEGK